MLSAETEQEVSLDAILKKSQDKAFHALLPEDITLLITSFLPSLPFAIRAKAFITLSATCQRFRDISSVAGSSSRQADASTEAIVASFRPPAVSKLADTNEADVLAGLTFLTALFQVDFPSASVILLQDGVSESITDSIDLFPKSHDISLAVAQLVSQAAGHKSSRPAIPSQCVQWLELKTRQTEDIATRAAAAVALVKFSRGSASDAAETIGTSRAPSTPSSGKDEELVKLMKGVVLTGSSSEHGHPHETTSLGDAVEGLAYLSVDPTIKEQLSSDSAFLKHLFDAIPRRKGSWIQASEEEIGMTPLYGTVVIIANLCAYRPRLTAEEAQIAKLRRLAKTPADGTNPASETANSALDDNPHVLARGRRLIKAGVLDALTAAVKATDSRAVRLLVGKVLLSLVEDTDSRGKILQAGGAKALISIIQGFLPVASASEKSPELDPSCIDSIQALAKLAITSSPVQVFGPNAGALLDAIRPFSLMLVHPSSNLLQQFEAMMALTNLSSYSEEAANKIVKADGVINRVDLFMLEDHTLIRRAATELICNLVAGCEDMFDKYGGSKNAGSKSKLQVLVAMCDVEDLRTRLAASGALATLTTSPDACQLLLELQRERNRILPILGQLVDPSIIPPSDETNEDEAETENPSEPDPGLVHRGVVCIRNLLVGVEDEAARKGLALEAERLGIVRALARVFRENSADRSSPVLRSAAEALKCMMESGIAITM